LKRVSKLEREHVMNIGDKLVSTGLVTLPQSAEIRDCLRVLSDSGILCQKRRRAILSWDTLEYQPVYYDNQKHQ